MVLAHVESFQDIADGSATDRARSRWTRKWFQLKGVWITILLNAPPCLPVAGWHTQGSQSCTALLTYKCDTSRCNSMWCEGHCFNWMFAKSCGGGPRGDWAHAYCMDRRDSMQNHRPTWLSHNSVVNLLHMPTIMETMTVAPKSGVPNTLRPWCQRITGGPSRVDN